MTHMNSGFLPDFCNLRTVLAVVVIAELLVFVLVLAQPAGVDLWQALSLYSLYVQWVALGCTVLLCLLRNALNRLRPLTAGLLAWLLVMAVTALVAHLAWTLVLLESEGTRAGFMLRSLGLAAVVAAVALRYLYLQQDWRRRIEAASSAREQALQARIRPHFLFNSLNTIAEMIPSRPRQAETAVEDLADLFRASLESGEGLSTLDDELALARGYLNMEQLRLGDRLQVDWETDDLPGQLAIPPMTLQPLLENAVYHGIEPRRDGGRLVVSGRVRDGRLQVCVRNPLPPDGAVARGGFGIAQDNVRERLRLAYGGEGHLSVQQEDDCYSVCLTLPCDPGEAGAGQAERGKEHAHSDRG
ncbi:sensor histidine kinase [Aquisalimonas asiatica]|nr:sensor histidine kinase [Aquisalimonas asiatica]